MKRGVLLLVLFAALTTGLWARGATPESVPPPPGPPESPATSWPTFGPQTQGQTPLHWLRASAGRLQAATTDAATPGEDGSRLSVGLTTFDARTLRFIEQAVLSTQGGNRTVRRAQLVHRDGGPDIILLDVAGRGSPSGLYAFSSASVAGSFEDALFSYETEGLRSQNDWSAHWDAERREWMIYIVEVESRERQRLSLLSFGENGERRTDVVLRTAPGLRDPRSFSSAPNDIVFREANEVEEGSVVLARLEWPVEKGSAPALREVSRLEAGFFRAAQSDFAGAELPSVQGGSLLDAGPRLSIRDGLFVYVFQAFTRQSSPFQSELVQLQAAVFDPSSADAGLIELTEELSGYRVLSPFVLDGAPLRVSWTRYRGPFSGFFGNQPADAAGMLTESSLPARDAQEEGSGPAEIPATTRRVTRTQRRVRAFLATQAEESVFLWLQAKPGTDEWRFVARSSEPAPLLERGLLFYAGNVAETVVTLIAGLATGLALALYELLIASGPLLALGLLGLSLLDRLAPAVYRDHVSLILPASLLFYASGLGLAPLSTSAYYLGVASFASTLVAAGALGILFAKRVARARPPLLSDVLLLFVAQAFAVHAGFGYERAASFFLQFGV